MANKIRFGKKFSVQMTDDCKQIEWQIVISTFTESKVYFMIVVEIKIPDMRSSGLNGPIIIIIIVK